MVSVHSFVTMMSIFRSTIKTLYVLSNTSTSAGRMYVTPARFVIITTFPYVFLGHQKTIASLVVDPFRLHFFDRTLFAATTSSPTVTPTVDQ